MENEIRDPSRRTVLKAGAWSVPVIAVAVAAPKASASTQNPDAQSTAVLGNTAPNAGTNVNYTFFAQVADGSGGYEDGGSYKDGWYIDIAGSGAGYTSVNNLIGLTPVAGVPGRYLVVGEQTFVRFRLNGLTYSSSPGTIVATIYNTAGQSRGGIVIEVQPT
ncbi:hypothetical protein RWH45_00790 [Microbacterium sp. KSW4-17]|uniref:Uncharacterized protein n=1 Tax=Microbacterium galbum TaxID=3075994 RepID=A0ABU3T2X5_9MICO|nr:hypothetical protein [Microbacterium sp. KSW4-17]MDU0365727.1 hypothetical protein [Microbacterium sp. KSW4-17]